MRRTIKKQFWFGENDARELKRKADKTCLSEAAVIRFPLQGYEPKEQPGIDFFQKVNELGEIAAYLRRIVARAEQFEVGIIKEGKFIFYRVPKELFTNKKYIQISAEAKLLYGMLFDKMSLSEMNGWREEDGMVYQYFTIQSVQKLFKVGHDKAGKLFQELEQVDLIERKSLIYPSSGKECSH